MPHRDKFPPEYFESNPLDGEDAHGAYRRLQWGNSPRRTYRIEAPEPMAVLGELAKLFFVGGKTQVFQEGEMFVAIGTKSNRYYLVPMDKNGNPENFPKNFYRDCIPIVQIRRIDYYSDKGGEPGYYYHDHEKPYPMLYANDDHFVCEPAAMKKGRSYAVNDEGIIG